MRIAQVAPLWETVPPKSYGGTELVIYLLVEALIQQGHEVTLFAAEGSQTHAKLQACSPCPIRELPSRLNKVNNASSLYPGGLISIFYEMQLWQNVFNLADQFDIIHNHLGFLIFPFAHYIDTPIVTTLHGEIKTDSVYHWAEKNFLESYTDMPLVSISQAQRESAPHLNYQATVYHGLNVDAYQPSFSGADKDYLVFLGRFCEDKGPHHAIRIAKETGWKLILAGKVDSLEEQVFFEQEIRPHLDQQICYIGEVNHPQKVNLLRNARATLCPIQWREPFGLVLIESLACGTPVLALNHGSVPELLVDGKTGFIRNTVEDLIQKVSCLDQIDRHMCRQHVVTHFSVQKMTQSYEDVYQSTVEKHKNRCYSTGNDNPSEGGKRIQQVFPMALKAHLQS